MRFDHAIIAVHDLDRATGDFESLGFTVVYGGEHGGGLTQNSLITFADGTYLEVLAPTDPNLLKNPPEPGPGNYLFIFEAGEGFAAFVLHTDDLDAVVNRVRNEGIEIANPTAGGRIRADGIELAWRTAFPHGSFSPFFITDDTPRENRIRTESEFTTHANGALGISRVIGVVPNLEEGVTRYRSLLGVDSSPSRTIEGAIAATFRVGYLKVTIAEPSVEEGPLAEHLTLRGESLYQIEIQARELGTLITHGARMELVGA